MEKIRLSRNKNGKLIYKTSRGGKMCDITSEIRSKVIDLDHMTKRLRPVYKSLYIIKHKIIVPMARLEDNNIDIIYLNRHSKHVIFVHPNSEVFWNGKKV
jgi:hypothetical protein